MKFWVVVGAVVLACCGSAGATTPYKAGPAMQRWQEIARDRFAPSCGPVILLASSPGEQPQNYLATADVAACTITFDAAYWSRPRAIRCSVVVHEYGHLAGRGHSSDPRSVMYPVARVAGVPDQCLWPRRG